MASLNFKSYASSHVGLVRETNEDAFLCRDDAGLWAVADGLGGHEAGDVASRTVARHLKAAVGSDLESLLAATADALMDANAELIDWKPRLGPARTPGSTVAVLLLRESGGAITWAGDSRIYRLRDARLSQLTRDHSHVQELLDEELISADEAEAHPMAHAITRAVGNEPTLELESVRIDILAGDCYLLCTDGLSRLLSPAEIERLLQSGSREAALQSMLGMVLERGAPDNVTLVIVDARASSG